MENPFINVVVQPAYGKDRIFVTWTMAHGYAGADFFVYRSPDGATQWELLNDAPVRGSLFYEDRIAVDNRFAVTHYRLTAELEGREYLSPVIGVLGSLTRSQYAGARRIMQLEYMQMAKARDGVEVLLYTPLNSGAPCPGADTDTGQIFHVGVPESGEDCYGTPFIGGFAAPLRTWIRLDQIGPTLISDAPNGQSSDDPVICKARCLAFPKIKPGDLIVHRVTDNRYAVGDSVQGYYFAGLVAVAFDINLQLLERDDPRYRVPVPAL